MMSDKKCHGRQDWLRDDLYDLIVMMPEVYYRALSQYSESAPL